MGFSRENYRKIKREYEGKALRAQEEAQNRKRELGILHPDIKELDDSLSMAGLKIFEATVRYKDEKLEAELLKIKKENDALLKKRAALMEKYGIPADYTDVKYTCKECSDTGFIGEKMCSCFREILVTENIKSSGIGRLIERQSFENFDLKRYRYDEEIYQRLKNNFDDAKKFAESFRKVLLINIFVMAPMAVGMSAVARPLFEVLLGERWLPTVPYFEVIALAGVFYPLSMVAYNVLKVHSNGAIIFRLELLKKAIMTAVLAVTIPHSTMAIAYGLVAMTVVEFVVNFAATRRYTLLSWWQMVRTLIPSLLLTVAMYAAVKAVGYYAISFAPISLLLTQIAVGVVVYAVGAWVCRMEAFKELVVVVKGLLKR